MFNIFPPSFPFESVINGGSSIQIVHWSFSPFWCRFFRVALSRLICKLNFNRFVVTHQFSREAELALRPFVVNNFTTGCTTTPRHIILCSTHLLSLSILIPIRSSAFPSHPIVLQCAGLFWFISTPLWLLFRDPTNYKLLIRDRKSVV